MAVPPSPGGAGRPLGLDTVWQTVPSPGATLHRVSKWSSPARPWKGRIGLDCSPMEACTLRLARAYLKAPTICTRKLRCGSTYLSTKCGLRRKLSMKHARAEPATSAAGGDSPSSATTSFADQVVRIATGWLNSGGAGQLRQRTSRAQQRPPCERLSVNAHRSSPSRPAASSTARTPMEFGVLPNARR
jgi:hypothetical protein